VIIFILQLLLILYDFNAYKLIILLLFFWIYMV